MKTTIYMALVVAGLLAVGCGGDDEESASRPTSDVTSDTVAGTTEPAPTSTERGAPAARGEDTGSREPTSSSDGAGGSKKKKQKDDPPRGKEEQKKQKADVKRRNARKNPDDGQGASGGPPAAPPPPQAKVVSRACLRKAKTEQALARCMGLSRRELDRLSLRGCLALARRARDPDAHRRRCRSEYRRRQLARQE